MSQQVPHPVSIQQDICWSGLQALVDIMRQLLHVQHLPGSFQGTWQRHGQLPIGWELPILTEVACVAQ
jgi:hypothetical protein